MRLSPFSGVEGGVEDDAVQVYRRLRAVLQSVTGSRIRHSVLEQPLQDKTPEASVTHGPVVLFQIRFLMGRKIDGLLAAETIMGRQRFEEFRRPVAGLFLGGSRSIKFRHGSFPQNRSLEIELRPKFRQHRREKNIILGNS